MSCRPFDWAQDKLRPASIFLWFRWKAKENLDSGLRRNDKRKSRLLVDEFKTPRLGAEGHSVLEIVDRRVDRDMLTLGDGADDIGTADDTEDGAILHYG